MSDRIRLGNATLTRVIEWQVDNLPTAVFPHTPAQAWQELADEFAPTFWDDGGWRIALQIWVVEVDGLTVLVDTGAGNDKARPRMAVLDHLQTDFLTTFRSAGIDPADVDVVVNTHLHFDHVGWNTMRDNDTWVPTFPECPVPGSGARLSPLPSGWPGADVVTTDRGGRVAAAAHPNGVRGQRFTRGRADRVVVRRP